MLRSLWGHSSAAYRTFALRRTISNLPKSSRASPVSPDDPGGEVHSKQRTRGGHDLSTRYQRLEASLRQKGTLSQAISDLPAPLKDGVDGGELPRPSAKLAAPVKVETFHGFVVPQEPQAPGPDECCMSGCAVCVNDLYADALSVYQDALSALRTSLVSASIPVTEWPAHARTPTATESAPRTADIALSAFEEMEHALAAKKAAAAIASPRSSAAAAARELYEGVRWVVFSNR